MSDLRYPIGQVIIPDIINNELLQSGIETIKMLPERLKNEVLSLDQYQLDTQYRDGGWTVRQVIHHVSESHMNGFIRFKWALTENTPDIKAYKEEKWANLEDDKVAPISIGLSLIDALHHKWVYLMKSLSKEEWDHSYFHPEAGRAYNLKESLMMYQWHSNHHLAHITELKMRKDW